MDSYISSFIIDHLQNKHKIELVPNDLLGQGIICQVLSAGSPGWQQGRLKVRIYLDFVPEVPDEVAKNGSRDNSNHAELDELRQIS